MGYNPPMRRFKITLQYDGTRYNGWQIQRNGITIQGLIEDVIYRITRQRIKVIAAGRTDAGVHAIAQVAAFSIESSLTTEIFMAAMNAYLPRDIRVMSVEDVPLDFHPRYDAVGKRYFYLILNSHMSSVFLENFTWRIAEPLDIEAMKMASVYLTGEHDFSSFRASKCGAKTAVRYMANIDIQAIESIGFMTVSLHGPVIKVSMEANAFLRHMVRNIVGTLVEVGRGRIKPDTVKEILELKDRRLSGPTAPAKGLFLERICYYPGT